MKPFFRLSNVPMKIEEKIVYELMIDDSMHVPKYRRHNIVSWLWVFHAMDSVYRMQSTWITVNWNSERNYTDTKIKVYYDETVPNTVQKRQIFDIFRLYSNLLLDNFDIFVRKNFFWTTTAFIVFDTNIAYMIFR